MFGLVLAVATPARAQESEPLPLPDITKPLFTRARAPGCATKEALDEFIRIYLATRRAEWRADGCIPVAEGFRAVILETDGWFDQRHRVALLNRDGRRVSTVWTVPRGLSNEGPR